MKYSYATWVPRPLPIHTPSSLHVGHKHHYLSSSILKRAVLRPHHKSVPRLSFLSGCVQVCSPVSSWLCLPKPVNIKVKKSCVADDVLSEASALVINLIYISLPFNGCFQGLFISSEKYCLLYIQKPIHTWINGLAIVSLKLVALLIILWIF